jgi:hypothetical protein
VNDLAAKGLAQLRRHAEHGAGITHGVVSDEAVALVAWIDALAKENLALLDQLEQLSI